MKKAIILILLLMSATFLYSCKSSDNNNNNSETQIQETAEPQKPDFIPTPAAATITPKSEEPVQIPQNDEKKAEVSDGKPLSGKIICIDAGHGLNSSTAKEPIAPDSKETKRAFVSGTSGKKQTEEQLTLRLAKMLEPKLTALGADVHMTRTTHETNMSNIDRAKFANDLNAALAIRIHADGGTDGATGISMHVPSKAHVSNNVYTESKKAGQIVLDSVIAKTGAKNRGVIERNDLTGFNWSKIPVILIETGFMTTPSDDALLESDEYCGKLTDGMADGIKNYFLQLQ